MALANYLKKLFVERNKRVNLISNLVMIFLFLVFAYGFREEKTSMTAHLNELSIGTEPMLSIDDFQSPKVLEVETSSAVDGALVFTLFQTAPKYPASVVTELAVDALTVARKLKLLEKQIDNKMIRFVAVAPVKPGFGFEHARILSLNFNTEKLMEISQGSNFSFQDFLNSSRDVSYIADTGERYVVAFCRDHVSKNANLFCSRELK